MSPRPVQVLGREGTALRRRHRLPGMRTGTRNPGPVFREAKIHGNDVQIACNSQRRRCRYRTRFPYMAHGMHAHAFEASASRKYWRNPWPQEILALTWCFQALTSDGLPGPVGGRVRGPGSRSSTTRALDLPGVRGPLPASSGMRGSRVEPGDRGAVLAEHGTSCWSRTTACSTRAWSSSR